MTVEVDGDEGKGERLHRGSQSVHGHSDFLRDLFKTPPCSERVAGYLNTARRRPADFPFRVLYSCALPGHSKAITLGRMLSGMDM